MIKTEGNNGSTQVYTDKQYLPDGWEWKKLEEVCEEIFAEGDVPKNNYSKSKTDKYNIPIFANGEKNKGLHGYTNKARVKKPSITVSARGTIGYTEIRHEDYYPAVRLITIVPDKIIQLEFLYHAIRTLTILHNRTSIPQLTVPMIKDYEIPLPPLSEQKRIVAILDKAFTAIDKAKANAEKNLGNTKELFESYLNEIFATPGKDWEEKRLGEITHKIGSGATPIGGKKSYKDYGISLIRSLNVHDDVFKHDNLAFIDQSQANKLSNVTVESKDVLINITGASIARCNIVPDDILPARVNQHVSIIRLKPNTILPEFLHFMLIAKPHKDKLLFTGDKNGATRQALTKKLIENYQITYPDRKEQEVLLKKIKTVKTESINLRKISEQKITALDELKKSILKKAFEGEL